MSSQEGDVKEHYRIPEDELVVDILRWILRDTPTVRSQMLLHRLVLKRLREDDANRDFRISERRIRRLAATAEGIDLKIYCREGEVAGMRSECPVCGSEMSTIKNATLYGWTVSTGKMCPLCGYWTGKRERIPTRYVFMNSAGEDITREGRMEETG